MKGEIRSYAHFVNILLSERQTGMSTNLKTADLCSHLREKLFEENGTYHAIWIAMQNDTGLTAVVRSRQLHIYRNGKKILVLAGKTAPKIIREDHLCRLVPKELLK